MELQHLDRDNRLMPPMSCEDYMALSDTALAFIRQNFSADGSRFVQVSSCAEHLRAINLLTNAKAMSIAVKALGEHERSLHDGYVDIDTSTSETIFIKHQGASYAFTAADLIKLMRIHAIPIS